MLGRAPYRFHDPARFSVYDETICILKSAVQSAKLGRDERIGALKRLDQARRPETIADGPSVTAFIAEHRQV